jgi:hypothetical protein
MLPKGFVLRTWSGEGMIIGIADGQGGGIGVRIVELKGEPVSHLIEELVRWLHH